MVKLEKEQEFLNSLLEAYNNREHNEIYWRLKNIAKCKYIKGNGIKDFQEQFFMNFIINGESFNNYNNYYSEKLHDKLIRLRRQIDNNFMID